MKHFLQLVPAEAGIIHVVEVPSVTNPAISRVEEDAGTLLYTEAATTKRTFVKIFKLLLLVFFSAGISYVNAIEARSLITIIIMAFLTGVYLCHHPEMSSVLAPVYAVLEGVALGQVSAMSDKAHPGVVLQALIITFGIAVMVIFVNSYDLFKINPIFRKVVFLATAGITFLYLVDEELVCENHYHSRPDEKECGEKKINSQSYP